MASESETVEFYKELKAGLYDIFNDEKAKRMVEDKWTHSLKSNVMGLFNKIAQDFYLSRAVRDIFTKLYTDTIVRLMK